MTQTIGYPRIGRDREIKRALEGYWKGSVDAETLMATFWDVAEDGWRTQAAAGIDYVGVGSATLYDQMLDWAVRFGLVAERFQGLHGLDRYFAMARGVPGIPALEMTKWFDTNYHYLVPELDEVIAPRSDFEDFLALVGRAQQTLGDRAVPIVIGPVTLLALSRFTGDLAAALDLLAPHYVDLLEALAAMDVPEVQLHEPILVPSGAGSMQAAFETVYARLAAVDLRLNLVTYFDDLGETYPWVVALPVDVISLDFTRGDNLGLIQAQGWPPAKTLVAGLVDGRSVWRERPDDVQRRLDALSAALPSDAAVRVGASASLQFLPYAAKRESKLPAPLRAVLAFADEKLEELRAVADGERGGQEDAWSAFRAFSPDDAGVRERISSLGDADFARELAYAARRPRQVALPTFPMTTIGSFPQTAEVRRHRARYRRGEITEAEYQAGIDAFIAYTVGVQDGLGLDMLVHGEFERTDMVEYFAQKLTGFAFTSDGWVQSFGSRYVRPPIIYGDVTRPAPMTVREYLVAQSHTEKPVKGMLTGPVTIINWSYPRTDIPRQEIAYQLALALRDEIADLEAAGCQVVQVDEPALREGLPLKRARHESYLTWAVDAFRLATAAARPETQVHTHMCYSEFGDILEAIDRLDADVISIENARSDDATLKELADYGYAREVGPGVYDIHSPVVPEVAFIKGKLDTFVRHLDPAQLWVNPDCGLKTRQWDEVIPALRHMVDAVREMRAAVEQG
ncbi:MAG: 5-methyltetrahydropteroyltriglutamate--homocysteine S-methyltransferase [Anaerolineae bacterium]|nr:5-methyltetrahydropteroyltriglutamate--homocysteine S-methyltransferase [Anaerolineae bacterium]